MEEKKRGRYPIKRRFFELCDEHGIRNPEDRKYEAYQEVLSHVPADERHHWPNNVRDIPYFNEETFFVRPGVKKVEKKERKFSEEEVVEDPQQIIQRLKEELAAITQERDAALVRVSELGRTIFEQRRTIFQLREKTKQIDNRSVTIMALNTPKKVVKRVHWEKKTDVGNGRVVFNDKLLFFSKFTRDPDISNAIRLNSGVLEERETDEKELEKRRPFFIICPLLFREFVFKNHIDSEGAYFAAIEKLPEGVKRFFPDKAGDIYLWSHASQIACL